MHGRRETNGQRWSQLSTDDKLTYQKWRRGFFVVYSTVALLIVAVAVGTAGTRLETFANLLPN